MNMNSASFDLTKIFLQALSQGNEETSMPEVGFCRVDATNKEQDTLPKNVSITEKGLLMESGAVLGTAAYNLLFKATVLSHKMNQWLLGDLLLAGEVKWGKRIARGKYQEAAEALGCSESTLRNIVLTCRRFPWEKRKEGLSFTHHQEIAKAALSSAQRNEALNKAAEMSCSQLRKYLARILVCQERSTLSEGEGNGNAVCHSDWDCPLDLEEMERQIQFRDLPRKEAAVLSQWVRKKNPEKFTIEECEDALDATKDIALFHNKTKKQEEKLKNCNNKRESVT